MFQSGRVLLTVILLAVLTSLVGCATPFRTDAKLPPAPLRAVSASEDSGLLLKTGSMQLGPGVGQNQWRWRADGMEGL